MVVVGVYNMTGSAFDEDVGKSTSLDSWGRQVRISVTIPLTDSGE